MTTSIKILFLTLSLYTLQSLYSLSAYAQLVSDFRVNDDTTNDAQYAAKVGCDEEGNFVVVWYDERTTKNPRICGQIFNQNAQRIGNNFQVNNDQYRALPSLYVRKNGSFIVAWSVIQTKFRIFNRFGTPISDEVIVADSSGAITSVGGDSLGNFVIAWEQYNSVLIKHIYCQIIDSTGELSGNKIKVNDDSLNVHHDNPALTVRKDGSFIVTWNDTRPPSQSNCDDVYMQMFDRFGNKSGINRRVNDDFNPINLQFSPRISSDTSGKFVIAWNDDRLDITHGEVYAQHYDNVGNKIGQNFRVTTSSVQNTKGVGSVDFKINGEYLIYWTEFRNFIGFPYFQRYRNNSIPMGINFQVTSQAPSTEKFASDCAISNDKVISLWSDEKNGPFDVYCNIRSFSNPDTTVNLIQTSTSFPEKFLLHQNYPNPFNSHTNIVFEINKQNDYTLEIYNTLGMTVDRLDYKNLVPGTYKISYDASALSSGVYYYSMNSGSLNSVRKFIFLK